MADFRLPPVTLSSITAEASEIPWGVQMMNAPAVWEKTAGEGVVVAILDTGIDTDHPDLVGHVIGGRNFTPDYNGDPNNFEDNQAHGTHVAGTIAAASNQLGVVGVAPDVKLLIGKVLDGEGSGSYTSIVNGIRWAADWVGPNGERARVISMSLGGPDDYAPLHKAIQYAVSKGIVVVAAAGNEGDGSTRTNEYSYPGAYEEVIEVGAVDSNKRLATFSNTNDQIDVVAPGVNVLSTIPGGQWAKFSGTSMATPHVSAAVALLIALNETPEKQLTEPEIYQLLLDSAVDTLIDQKGEGKGLVVLKTPVEEPKPEPQPVPVPVQPTPVPQPEPTPTPTPEEPAPAPQPEPAPVDREYRVIVRKVGSRYNVEAGYLLSRKQANTLAEQLVEDLNSIEGVDAVAILK